MMARFWVGFSGAGCVLMMTWSSAFPCFAQDARRIDPREQAPRSKQSSVPDRASLAQAGARVDPANLRSRAEPVASSLRSPARELAASSAQQRPHQPWLWAAAGTSAALAAGFAFSEGFAYKATSERLTALDRSRDLRLDLYTRLRAEETASDAKLRAELLDRVSSVCLAGTIAATGTMLLVWLTAKEKRKPDQNKYLLGPMVLREFAGAGLVLREKF
jgi:hypothetical protein